MIARDDDLVIRRMRDHRDDYELMVRWRNLPHVRRFWDPDLPVSTLESITEEYQPDTAADSVSTACIIELRGEPIGFIQFYRWAAYPDEAKEAEISFDENAWGLDVFIGDAEVIDKGLGTRAVRVLSDHLIDERGASEVSLLTDVKNVRAQRCYEKAGFRKVKQVLDTDTYRGKRIRSWFMVKHPA